MKTKYDKGVFLGVGKESGSRKLEIEKEIIMEDD
jgi:hypothetical protein